MHPASECIDGREGMWKTADGSDCGRAKLGQRPLLFLVAWRYPAPLQRRQTSFGLGIIEPHREVLELPL
jgi:hypothetical protein